MTPSRRGPRATHTVRRRSFRLPREGTDIYPWLARPGRKVEEVEGETYWFVRFGQGQQSIGGRFFEEVFPQLKHESGLGKGRLLKSEIALTISGVAFTCSGAFSYTAWGRSQG